MDENSIYIKTHQGEDAVRDRSLLVQRELRTLLILIDGHATVADLRLKVGEGSLLQMLKELEKLGMISRIETVVQVDEVKSEAKHQGEGGDFLGLDDATDTAAGFGWCDAQPAPHVMPGYVTPIVKEPPRAGLFSRLFKRKPAAAKPVVTGKQLPVASGDARRRRRSKLAGPLMIMTAAGALMLVALLALVYAVYGRDHRPQFEALMADMLGQSVKINQAGIGFSPWPAVSLEDVRIGEHAMIRRIDLMPSVGSFFSANKTLHRARLSGLRLDAEGLPAATGWLAARRIDKVKLRALDIDNLSLAYAGIDLRGLHGQAQLTGDGVLTGLTLRDTEGRHFIELRPQDGAFAVSATLSQWKLPSRDKLLLPVLKLEGVLEPARWRLNSIEGTLFDGRIEGQGELIRDEQGVRLEARLNLARPELHGLLDALGGSPGIGGPSVGTFQLTARGPDLPRLLEDFRAEGQLRIAAGALHKLELVEALRQRGQPVEGGETRFEMLSGTLTVSEKSASFADLRIDSGLLHASGSLSRMANGLVGGFDVVLGDGVRGYVAVGGTINRPMLKATGR